MILARRMVVALALAACSGDGTHARTDGPTRGEPEGWRTPGASPGGGPRRPVILFLGTSLTAGYGLEPAQAYPALLQRKLDSAGADWQAVNAGLSGETSAGALRRLEWLLQGPIRILVIETGANDGLRGLDLDSTRANLEAIVARARSFDSTLTIVLAGMEVPPNLGPRYATRFGALFRDLAARERLALIPFLLEGVGGVDSLNQPDGIHPTAAGQAIVAANVWRVVGPMIRGREVEGPMGSAHLPRDTSRRRSAGVSGGPRNKGRAASNRGAIGQVARRGDAEWAD